MSEIEPTLQELLDDGYSLPQAAYLVMETALAKRVLEDRKRDGQWKGHGWEDLVQTSHESLWQAARREAGLPDTSAFKSQVISRDGTARVSLTVEETAVPGTCVLHAGGALALYSGPRETCEAVKAALDQWAFWLAGRREP